MTSRASRILRSLALERPEARAWALYDWANSAVWTTVITAVYPIYFTSVVAVDLGKERATRAHALATTIALVLIALLSPLLGALADLRARKKLFLAAFAALGIAATAGLFWIGRGDWRPALVLFVLVNVGVVGSTTFYDALLPHVARPDEVDRLSASGYALGYLGGGLLLALDLLCIERPGWFGLDDTDPTLPPRLAFLSVALWWGLFSLPLLRRVPEPPRTLEADETADAPVLRTALTRLGETFRALRRFRDAFLLLVAFLLYNDGILTIVRLATIFGDQHGFRRGTMIGAILGVQFVGIPCALAFGKLAQRVPAKRLVFVSLVVYTAVALLAQGMSSETHFLVLAFLVATVQGGSQALSRSLFASMVPKHKSGEFFALFGIGEKFAGIFGPFLFWAMSALSGSSEKAILSLVVFFAVGAVLLAGVDVERGRRVAAEAERDLRPT